MYAYCRNNPVFYIDPSGHYVCPKGVKRIVNEIKKGTSNSDDRSRLLAHLQEKREQGQALTRREKRAEKQLAGDSGRGSGIVEFKATPDATPAQIAQVKAYVDGCNEALKAGKLSSTGRVSTQGLLRRQASRAARKEAQRAANAGTPYTGHVGHVPDTTWTGTPDPYDWLDLDPVVNTSLGGQSNGYPIGYKPTGFVFKEDN